MGSGLKKLMAESLQEGIFTGIEILFNSFKTMIVQHPAETIMVVLILVGLHVLDRKTQKKK